MEILPLRARGLYRSLISGECKALRGMGMRLWEAHCFQCWQTALVFCFIMNQPAAATPQNDHFLSG